MSGELVLKTGYRYNFHLHGNGILPAVMSDVKIIGNVDGRTAERLGFNVSARHAQVYPLLPVSSVSTDYTSQRYYLVEFSNGSQDAIGEFWIKYDTVTGIDKKNISIQLVDVTPEAEAALRDILSANGYSVTSIQEV